MRFWKRSIRQDDRSDRDFTRARRPSRKRRLQLENLEGRALLSTWTLSETFGTKGVREVVVQFNNRPPTIVPITANPPPTFVLIPYEFDTVNVLDTKAGVPILIRGNTQNTIDVGDLGSVQGILARVTIVDPTNRNTIFINDQADPAARTATLSTSAPGMGEVTGLAPAPITFAYSGTSSVYLEIGTGYDAVDVQATGVPTNIFNFGRDTAVNVGNAGSVQGIQGYLNIYNYPVNLPGGNPITIDDSADPAGRMATLYASDYDPSDDPEWLEDTVTGLAPAPIQYNILGTQSLAVQTGTGADTVNVQDTDVPTYIHNHGPSTVNVGDAGSVEGIEEALYVLGPPSLHVPGLPNPGTTLNIDASAYSVPDFATLGSTGFGGEWGYVTGLAPAPINYLYASTSSMHLTTNHTGYTIDVQATGVPTYITTSGYSMNPAPDPDTVNIGNAGSLQGILSALYVSNPSNSTAVHIDDSADTVHQAATLSSFTGSDGRDWGSIAGLAPAAINFTWGEMFNQRVDVSAPMLGTNISWTVNPDAYESVVGVYVFANGLAIN